jgi:hypothetical protein
MDMDVWYELRLREMYEDLGPTDETEEEEQEGRRADDDPD